MHRTRLAATAAAVLLCGVALGAAESSLVEAVKAGDREAVRALLTPGTVNAPATDGTTALHWAVRANDVETTDLLIRAGADVTVVSRYGVTPLALAALNANDAIVRRLLDAGADANAPSPEGETALMTAARTGSVPVVRTLLERGADPNARERWLGQTALMWAAAENHGPVVETLLEVGADANIASRFYPYADFKPLDAGTPKAPTSRGGMTALQYAARQGATDAVRAIADSGVDLDQADPEGVTPLLYAAINGHTRTAALLLERGANPNVADTYGRTALYVAVDLNTLETATPRPAPETDEGVTPLALAALVIARGAAVNAPITSPLPPRSTQGNNDTTPPGATPIWRAAKTSDVAAVRLLLEAGADASAPSRDGITPLMVAAGQAWEELRVSTEQASIDTIALLLAAGVDVNLRNTKGETALHGAADRKAAEVIAFLAENGARLDTKDASNRTALDVAMGVPPVGGYSPFDYRIRTTDEAMVQRLRDLMTANGVAIEPYEAPGRESAD